MGLANGRSGTPQEEFLADLTKLADEFLSQSHDLLICGDFNETFAEGANSFSLATSLGLVDLLGATLHDTNFNTHQRNHSNRRIDYALASPSLIQSIKHAGYFPFGLYYKGDHQGFYMDFNLTELLGEQVPDILTPKRRALNSNHKKNRATYVRSKYEELMFHNFFDRLTTLCNS